LSFEKIAEELVETSAILPESSYNFLKNITFFWSKLAGRRRRLWQRTSKNLAKVKSVRLFSA
jgi:hypothetical protein